MSVRTKQIVTVLFGITAAAIGAWRHLETGDSMSAVWFGVTFCGIAVVGAAMLTLKNPVMGYVAIALSVLFEAGWFLHRALTHAEGFSPRVLIILAACAVETIALAWRARTPASAVKAL